MAGIVVASPSTMDASSKPSTLELSKLYAAHLTTLQDPNQKDEAKMKAAQELNEHCDLFVASPIYPQFLDQTVNIFLKLLQEGRPHFIAEFNAHLARRHMLELLHRFPADDKLKPYAKSILSLAFKLLEYENEEIVLVALRIIIELHKQYRPSHSAEITNFLRFVKKIYQELPNNMNKIFELKKSSGIRIQELNDLNLDQALSETFTMTTITTERGSGGSSNSGAAAGDSQQQVTYNLIPKAVLSLKVLQELPIIVVLMYQLYKSHVHQEVAEFIPLIMNTIALVPDQQRRNSPDFNKEIFVDFMGAQIKTLSFLAYIIRIYQDHVSQHSNLMVKGILSMLSICPHEVAHLRKELLIAARHILATDLRNKFVPHMDKLFDENVLLGKGWTTYESLRPLAYSTLADLVHHVRQHLPLSDLGRAVQLFSRNVHDDTLPTSIQTMSCKLLLNLVECIRSKSEQDESQGRELLMRMMEVFVLKFKTVAKMQLPVLLAKHKQQQQQTLQQPQHHLHNEQVQQHTSVSQNVQNPQTQQNQSQAKKQAQKLRAQEQKNSNALQQQLQGQATHSQTSGTECRVAPFTQADSKDDVKRAIESATGATSSSPIPLTEQDSNDQKRNSPGNSTTGTSQKFGFPSSPSSSYSVSDCRTLVKTLVCGAKTITWGCTSLKADLPQGINIHQSNKHFPPKDTLVYIRLVRWAMEALDIYTLNATAGAAVLAAAAAASSSSSTSSSSSSSSVSSSSLTSLSSTVASRTGSSGFAQQSVRTKEEKEVLEHFAGVFALLSPLTFKEIFSETIEFVVERIFRNNALQIMANSFLANNVTSPIFATILVEYLLDRMHEMGSNMERSNLYLKLFKLVFGSVSLFAAENEQMLKPHLHSIVNRSMELAKTAKEPYNYFLLLRALFRSIGGGSHDLLYQEFLPLLPSLLQGLNSLQSGLHKQHMKDLFVELCLTVPVRLSSLLPYLPMLMDPLVSALNGSPTLVSQGLRTLELCVDNLQPDFLYEHIQPVRAELMQALWRTLRSPSDQIALVAFRVLGKFGGGNRKMMIEAQSLDYKSEGSNNEDGCQSGPLVQLRFPEHKSSIALPISKVIATAFNALKSSSTEPGFYRKQCWEAIRCFLVSSLSFEDEKATLMKLLSHPSFREAPIPAMTGPHYKCPDKEARNVHQMAVTGMFVAAAIKELRQSVLPTMVALVRHYTMVAVAQEAGPFPASSKQSRLSGMDPLVLIDALAIIMGHEEKELCKPGHLAMVLILDTATNIVGSKARACRLPLMEYLAQSMCDLCYQRAWYAKLGGCIAIKFLFERMDLRWVFLHQFAFLKALLFVMTDLSAEVSSGAIDMAKSNLEKMLNLCASNVSDAYEDAGTREELVQLQKRSLFDVTRELVRQVTSPNGFVRDQAKQSLQLLATIQGRTVTDVMQVHKEVLQDMTPHKKHFLRHQPVNAQIGLMDGNTFCTSLQPRLFTLNLKIMEHKVFFTELLTLSESDDVSLQKLPCYKSVTNLIPLRQSALKALASCHYIPDYRDKVFKVIFTKALNSNNDELVETGFECMKTLLSGCEINTDIVAACTRDLPDASDLENLRNLNSNLIKRLCYMAELFPSVFTGDLCKQLLQLLKEWLETAIRNFKQGQQDIYVSNSNNASALKNVFTRTHSPLSIAASIIKLFEKIPPSHPPVKIIEMLCKLVLATEKNILIEPGSILRPPLIQYLKKHPSDTIEYFMNEAVAKDSQSSRFIGFVVKDKKHSSLFLEALKNKEAKLISLLSSNDNNALHLGIKLTWRLVKHDPQVLLKQPANLVDQIRKIWSDEKYHERHYKTDTVDYSQWKEPRLIVKILLKYFKLNKDTEIGLLFQLLRALCQRYLCDFQFLKDYLEDDVCQKLDLEWRRKAFFHFVEIWKDTFNGNEKHIKTEHEKGGESNENQDSLQTIANTAMSSQKAGITVTNFSQELLAKILQFILIPSFASAFEQGQTEELVVGRNNDKDGENVVGVFISDLIDPDHPFKTSDGVRILLLQMACLLVEQAPHHIHDSTRQRGASGTTTTPSSSSAMQGRKLRPLMTYAWPCLLSKNCVDPATRYHGHLLLAHIIAKFAIHKRIVLQVFHSLLKAHAVEARGVVRQALEKLTPSMPGRMEDGNTMLIHWTKKIIVEEGHTGSQLVHILQLVVKHYKVYYPVRQHLITHIVSSIQRLGLAATATLDQKRLAVDLCDVVIKWELQRVSESNKSDETDTSNEERVKIDDGHDRKTEGDERMEVDDDNSVSAGNLKNPPSAQSSTLDRSQSDAIANSLLKLACQVSDSQQATTGASPGELLSRRCVTLLKLALKPEVWPNCDLKLQAFEKVLSAVDTNQTNYVNICTCLDILTFLLSILRRDQILVAFKPLQKAIGGCMACSNTKVIRALHTLMSRLMHLFPTEATSCSMASKHEELEQLYASVAKVVYEGLANYEKNAHAQPATLFSTLMMLKAACTNNPGYIDRLITSFMRVLQRMTRDHLSNNSVGSSGSNNASTTGGVSQDTGTTSELLILSLDLVKNRVGVMGVEMRKAFIGTILVGLIERSSDVKILKAITKMLEDWMKSKDVKTQNQGPSLKEKSILLVKMMANVEKRFSDDADLNANFLDLVNFVYRDEALKTSELTSKLEQAFLSGLRCTQPQIRASFFDVFERSMRQRLHERLMYIVCSQNWETMGPHFWIKQCIELLLMTAVSGTPMIVVANNAFTNNTFANNHSSSSCHLPAVSAVIGLGEPGEQSAFEALLSIKEEEADVETVDQKDEKEETEHLVADIELSNDGMSHHNSHNGNSNGHINGNFKKSHIVAGNMAESLAESGRTLSQLIARQYKFLESRQEIKTVQFLSATSQLAHMDTALAEHIWLELFPRLWRILTDNQRESLASEIVPFVCSGIHNVQKECQPSALNTFVEALATCTPKVMLRPQVLRYIGKSHNLWHRATLLLEDMALENNDGNNNSTLPSRTSRTNGVSHELDPSLVLSAKQEALHCLSDMYSLLREEDQWAALWRGRAKYSETNIAIAYEQQGFFEQAQGAYELAMTKYRNDRLESNLGQNSNSSNSSRNDGSSNLVNTGNSNSNNANTKSNSNTVSSGMSIHEEVRLWEAHWLRSSKELDQWETLLEYGNSKVGNNAALVLEASWRNSNNWPLMRDALTQLESACPKELSWKTQLWRGYTAVCQREQHLNNSVERNVEQASALCIKEWRRLPRIVSHIHLPVLQAAQLVMELQEAAQIHQGLVHGRPNSLHDMKAIVKTWRNRLPVVADDLSHWADIFTWRQHHYTFITNHFSNDGSDSSSNNNSDNPNSNANANSSGSNSGQSNTQGMMGVHASAQAIIHFGKIARKHNLTSVCLESLSKIYNIATVPIVDCFQKIRQQVKCYMQTSSIRGLEELQEGLEVIDSTNLKYFTKEMTAEFYALKGNLLAQLQRSDEANKAFSAAVQLHDTLIKAWALWGEYLEGVFVSADPLNRPVNFGVDAITCYLHACRHQNESKSRKYLAKVLWLLTYDDEATLKLAEALEKYHVGVPAIQWLPWVPQLLTCLVRAEGKLVLNLLSTVGRMFPQAVYFPIRTLYLTLKIEQRDRVKDHQGNKETNTATVQQQTTDGQGQQSESGPIKAPEPMVRCSKVMYTQRELHPTVLSCLEGIVDQMVWFRENWYEEVLRQLRQGLAKCYIIAFYHRGSVSEATITSPTLNFVKKLVSTFGIGIESVTNNAVNSSMGGNVSGAANESLVRRAQASACDPVFQKMKSEFTSNFDFSVPGAMKLQNLIQKLKKWIKILEAKTKVLPKSFLIEEKCRFLSNFTRQTAEIELPGELLLPKHSHYQVCIQRFMPRVEIVQKHNSSARRLYIRGHNGKIYPYLVVNDSGLGDARREERVLQVLRMTNHLLSKHKETSRRFLNFTVPRVVAVSPQMRLVEDNKHSVSLLDVYKERCFRRGLDHHNPIAKYYERLATVQAKGNQASQLVLRDILREVQQNMVPRRLLLDWACSTFPSATDFWTFRKLFTLQLALVSFAEWVLHLSRLNADMLYVHQDSGFLNVAYFKFDVDDVTGDLDANRPVPFRLTPNICEFVSELGLRGPMSASLIATARCMNNPNFKLHAILRAVLRDEMIAWHKRSSILQANQQNESEPQVSMQTTENQKEREAIISAVNKAITSINGRLATLAAFDGTDSKADTLINVAAAYDNLCRMDPAWHPWL